MTGEGEPMIRPYHTKEELVARHLRESIAAGRLAPGQRLLQNQIARELGVSPTPVREAIRALVTEGWLTSESHIGVSVAEINSEGIDEIYRLRALLEGDLAAEAARRISPPELGELRRLGENYERAARARDLVAARAANLQFHVAIWEVAGSPVGVNLLNLLWARVPRPEAHRISERSRKSVVEHEEVMTALASGDSERARAALAEHVRSGQIDYHRSVDHPAGATELIVTGRS